MAQSLAMALHVTKPHILLSSPATQQLSDRAPRKAICSPAMKVAIIPQYRPLPTLSWKNLPISLIPSRRSRRRRHASDQLRHLVHLWDFRGRTHSLSNIPLLIAGSAGGKLKTDLHYSSYSQENANKPVLSIIFPESASVARRRRQLYRVGSIRNRGLK